MKMVKDFLELLEGSFKVERHPRAYAGWLGISIKKLNKHTGFYLDKTVHGVIEYRVHDEVLLLLRTTDLKVIEIADVLGLSDPSWLARCFKKYEGCSPKDYRKRVRGKA
ncbi:helix-turn-helix domain-containing protein [Pedobacter frigoris]|uniref:AraC family transcriptional regulator n=1 Tax=Pedobacter frigoris TaxID=2571272 RepID=A0A4U1CTC4_9SPHI|nr:helix-turn-helix domain-containing protein [Pedobacter frigoris]TKC08988.1 AraC family transcriptional regulator [Pedobacter frigoris]